MTDSIKPQTGKAYVLNNGSRFRVYADDGGGETPIHGAMFYGGRWHMRRADASGQLTGGLYIVSEFDWRAEIPWDALADEIEHVAMDEDGGCWYGYEDYPKRLESDKCWDGERCQSLGAVKMPAVPHSDWRNTHVQRPAKEQDND